MAAIDVVPSALVSAAAAVRCISLDLEPVVFGGSIVGAITDDFDARWRRALRELSSDADATASSLRAAAADYAHVDRFLVPR